MLSLGARRRAGRAACLRSDGTAPVLRAALRCAAKSRSSSELYLRLIAHGFTLGLFDLMPRDQSICGGRYRT